MKRFFKIFGITLGSIIGLIVITVIATFYIVLTPQRLTPIVHRVADHFISCPYQVEKVDITLLRTFPYLGLELKGIYIINPVKGAPSDTVLAIPDILIGVEGLKAIHGDIVVKQFEINDVVAHIYISPDGQTNYDVLSLVQDSTKEDSDTTAGWTLQSVVFENSLEIKTQTLQLCDERDSLFVTIPDLALHLNARLPDCNSLLIEQAKLTIADCDINIDGMINLSQMSEGTYGCDLNINTNPWHISHLLALVPDKYTSLIPKDIIVDGDLQLAAHTYGQLDSTTLPLIDARLQLGHITGHYDLNVLPYIFTHTEADILAHVDLNKKANTTASIQNLFIQTGPNTLRLSGDAEHILRNVDGFEIDNPACNLKLDVNVDLAEANRYLNTDSSTTQVEGLACGTITAHGRWKDVINAQWSKLKAEANLHLTNASYRSDSLQAVVDKGDIIASIDMPKNETSKIPTLALSFNLDNVQASLDTLSARLVNPVGSAKIKATRRNADAQRISVSFSADELFAAMGEQTNLSTGKVEISASSRYNKDGENIFFKWNPHIHFDLHNAVAHTPAIPATVEVPQIRFNYSNRDFTIDTSRIVLGQSDFNLSGEIKNFGKWTQHKDTLEGWLNFTSSNTNVDELLSLLPQTQSDTLTVNEPSAQEQKDSTTSNPFLVPENINLTLNTRIKNAHAFDQNLKNLGGTIVVHNGVVFLDQMGFVCEAAKLQLSAIYKTPRRNHIYVGLDYHMIDVDIQQLISMVPQLDTLVPMLNSFRGRAEFHLAAETYLTEQYKLKPSTIRGACSIEGKDLVLLDSETFDKISKILMFSKKTENKIDSISAQITLYKDEITVYPFSLSMDNYLIALGGNHYLDMTFNYHADLLKPLYVGVDVKGNLDNLHIVPATCIYAQDFRPIIHKDTETKSHEIRRMISENLKKSVKIQ